MDSVEKDTDDIPFIDWLYGEMNREYQEKLFMELAYKCHEDIWGVPCGPTLTMVYPTELRGIDYICQ